MFNISGTCQLVDSVPNTDVLNLMIDTVLQVDVIRSESGETVKSFVRTAEAVSGNELTVADFQAVVREIESLVSQKKKEMMNIEESKDEDSRQSSRNLDVTIAYMVARCIDYAIETYPVRVLGRLETRLKSKFGKDVLKSMISEFKSSGFYTLNSIYHDENPDFMDDIVNVLDQNVSLKVDNLVRIRAHIGRVFQN